jgi:hypothetical protein
MQFHAQYAETVARLEEALNSPKLMVFGRVNKWLEDGAEPDEIIEICTRIAKQGRWNGSSLSYFDGPIAQSIADRTKPLPVVAARAERKYERKADPVYAPVPELDQAGRDRLDVMYADMLNRGQNVMSVTYQDAQRMMRSGLLNAQAAGRFGL